MQQLAVRYRSVRSQRGQGMAEYIIIVALVAVAGIAVWSSVGSAIHNQASGVAAELAGWRRFDRSAGCRCRGTDRY